MEVSYSQWVNAWHHAIMGEIVWSDRMLLVSLANRLQEYIWPDESSLFLFTGSSQA